MLRLLWWIAMVLGITYGLAVFTDLRGPDGAPATIAVSVWKGACVGVLALWAALQARNVDGWLITLFLALGAFGDFIINIVSLQVGAIAFASAHLFAIALFLRNARLAPAQSQRLLAIILTPASVAIVYFLLAHRSDWWQGVAYIGFAAAMASMAWRSRFPRYRCGIGAVIFVVCDVIILVEASGQLSHATGQLIIWPLYFAAQTMIAWGVVPNIQRTDERAFDETTVSRVSAAA